MLDQICRQRSEQIELVRRDEDGDLFGAFAGRRVGVAFLQAQEDVVQVAGGFVEAGFFGDGGRVDDEDDAADGGGVG